MCTLRKKSLFNKAHFNTPDKSMEIILIVCLLLLAPCSSSSGVASDDEQALLAFKNSITSDPHRAFATWNSTATFCSWSGVNCTAHNRVLALDLGSLNLKGSISPFLGNLSFMERLNISNNTLEGGIPQELGHRLNNLKELHLWGNQLSGPIPNTLGNCSKLEVIDLSLNKLQGTVPLELGKLGSLQRLILNHNSLTTTARTLHFLTALVNCSILEKIDLDYNYLSGTLPPYIGFLSPKLSILALAQNLIVGSIPPQIGNLTSLTLINFTANSFTGSIPSTLGSLKNLERLYLGHNQLQGKISREIGGSNKSLGLLSLSFNQLSGPIPETIGDLSQLRRLYLDNNQFQGTIPAALGNCSLLELLDLSHNHLSRNIPPEVAGLQNIVFYFNLSWNSLEGSLPKEFSNMNMAQGVDLSHNFFHGSIPSNIFQFPDLQSLDLSYNDFSGTIPISFQSLKQLTSLNLSFNRFTGEIPKGGLFANLSAASFRGNPGLCGEWIPLMPECPSENSRGHRKRKFRDWFKYVSVGIFSLMGYILYIRLLYKHCFPYQEVEVALEPAHPRISCKELVNATNGFGRGNLLGAGSSGSVYKGVLDDGTLVAVKVHNLHSEAAIQSFSMECQVLGKARHRNLVKVITSCSNLDFKGLVLEFMCNGSLDQHLHCGDIRKSDIGGVCKMNLQKILEVATDIARGLAYLHHECSIQVVHCDLKPSNVLLDYYMTAHVSDFGCAQILSQTSTYSSSSALTLKGSVGYIAPEYGVGARISTKGDVYSYGVVVLEMVSGKRPTDKMFVEGLDLRMWISMAFPDRVSEVVDAFLLHGNGGGNCLLQLIRVGLLCTKQSPKERPSMKEVVELLESIGEMEMHDGSRMDSKFPSDLYEMCYSRRRTTVMNEGQSSSTF